MSDEKKNEVLSEVKRACTAENFQKYVLGSKKNGQPRAIYDVVRDYVKPPKKHKGKKKKKNKTPQSAYEFYVGMNTGKKKKKKKKKKHLKYPF